MMLLRTLISLFLVLIFAMPGIRDSYGSEPVAFTQDDRDRLIRLEVTLKEFKESVDKRFEQVDKRFEQVDKRFEQVDKRFESVEKLFDRLTNIFLGIVAAFAGVVAVTIGFAIWDRKTTLKPAMERVEKIEIILKRFAGKEPKLAEVLRTLGLL